MSILTTLIARVSDGLVLAGSMVDEKGHDLMTCKNQAKRIFKQLGPSSPPSLSIEAGPYFFHYIVEHGVCYLMLCQRSFPRKLAFAYLQDLSKQFNLAHGKDVERAPRPYAFVAFDIQIQKTKRQYTDMRSQRLEQLDEDLQDVRSIMTKNITEVLGRGERLDTVQDLSSRLKEESTKFKVGATQLKNLASWNRFWPLAAVGAVVGGLLYIRFKYF
ncbi:putative 25.3 kDa vesicle transport protein [Paratrimastix pyriformis]|uniref:25.3 kDa vesicle transport protein n=1 Tax=Paratrimastix pyriformis TaxID=342808 RepID=A0ABQ8UT58_9EUKA|nr:putative 25.3 kDa vesicle transport protein [Paratrimastix pyriformis]